VEAASLFKEKRYMLYLSYRGHVNLGFYRALELKDPKKLLEGTGKNMRHIKIKSMKDIDKEYFWELVSDAISIDK